MNRLQFIKEVSRRTGIQMYLVKETLDAIREIFEDAIMEEERVVISGIGTLNFVERKRKKYRRFSGEMDVMPKKTIPVFSLSEKLRNLNEDKK